MLSFNILITCVIVLMLKFYWSRRHFYYASWKLPGVLAFPLIGSSWIFWNTSTEVVWKLSDLVRKLGTPFGFWLGTRFVIYFSKPEHAEIVINSSNSMDKGGVYKYIQNMIGGPHGLLSSGGDLWKMHRRLLNPTVQHYKIVNSFYPTFNKNLKIMMENLNHKCGKGTFDIYEYLESCSFDITCKTTLGVDSNVQRKQNLNLLKAFTEALHIVGIRIFQPWLQVEPFFRISKYYDMKVKTTSDLRSFIKEILQKRILQLSSTADMGGNDDTGGKKLRIFIDECIKLSIEEKCFTEEEIITETLTILLAGYETVALTVSNIMIMLALHPEYQEKVFREVRGIFPHNDSVVTADDLKQLDFTDRVIKETMRLLPTIPFMARMAKENFSVGKLVDFRLIKIIAATEGKCFVPAKTELIISVFSLQRNKDIWGADSESFNPDHFLPENIEHNHPYSFMPYSAGARNCMGKKYAQILVRIFVIWLVRNYVFSTDLKLADLRYTWMIGMKLKGGYQVKMEERQKY